MPRTIHISPNTFPAISQRWRAASTDPQQFFNSDGTVDSEFFFTPEAVANATSMRAARMNLHLDFACGTGSINITK